MAKSSAKRETAGKRKILDAAIDVISERGYDAASMRAIATRASVRESTVYKHFASKEKIVDHYFEDRTARVFDLLKKTKGWERFTFREQTQTMFDAYLGLFVEDRDFVRAVFGKTFLRPVVKTGGAREMKEKFIEMVKDMVQAAAEVGEIPQRVVSPLMYEFLWGHFIAVVCYWIKDVSENFENTTVFTDKSLALAEAALKTRVVEAGEDLFGFIFKTHVTPNIEWVGRVFEESPLKSFFAGEKEKTPRGGKRGKGKNR